MRKIGIQNLRRRPQMFTLPHKPVCIKLGMCLCGKKGVPMSIHLPALGTVDTYLMANQAEDVQKALLRKDIKFVPAKKEKTKTTVDTSTNNNSSQEGNEPGTTEEEEAAEAEKKSKAKAANKPKPRRQPQK